MDFSISGISGKVYNFSIPAREMGTFSILFTKAYHGTDYSIQSSVLLSEGITKLKNRRNHLNDET